MSNGNGANLGFEDKLWSAADKLRGTMDAAEYKHVVLGLIFLKYISDAFLEKHNALRDEPHADPELQHPPGGQRHDLGALLHHWRGRAGAGQQRG